MGIQLSVLLGLASNVSQTVTTAEFLRKHILPKTVDQKCRWGSRMQSKWGRYAIQAATNHSDSLPPPNSSTSRYIDLIAEKLVSAPQYYVIHFHGSSFHALVNTLRTYFETSKEKFEEIYVWIDLVCVNHHTEQGPSEVDAISDLIRRVDKVLTSELN